MIERCTNKKKMKNKKYRNLKIFPYFKKALLKQTSAFIVLFVHLSNNSKISPDLSSSSSYSSSSSSCSSSPSSSSSWLRAPSPDNPSPPFRYSDSTALKTTLLSRASDPNSVVQNCAQWLLALAPFLCGELQFNHEQGNYEILLTLWLTNLCSRYNRRF